MKSMKTLIIALVSSGAVLLVSAQTQNPTASPKPSPTGSSTPATTSSPANRPTASDAASPNEELKPTVAATPASGVPPPNPVLYLMGQEPYSAGGKNWIRCRYDVANKMSYPADMFAPAPSLPPCGANTNSSRTWVDFFKQDGSRIYGFCALSKPEDLGKIWFAFEEGTIPPSYVYIELNDRQANKKYKSNLADTTL